MLCKHVQVNGLVLAADGSHGCRFWLFRLLFSLLFAADGRLCKFQAYARPGARIEEALGLICRRDRC